MAQESFGDRLRFYRERSGLSRQQLADRLQVSRAAIALLENGDSKSMAPENLLRAADALGVSPFALQFGDELRSPQMAYEVGGKHYRNVPIIGMAIATPNEDGFYDDMGLEPGAGEGYIGWATKDPNAYALQVKSDSMQPRMRPGEYVIVEPNASVSPGDDVVVRTKAGRKLIKRLLYQRGSEVTLGSVNDRHSPLTLLREEIDSIHHIGGIAPRSAKEEP